MPTKLPIPLNHEVVDVATDPPWPPSSIEGIEVCFRQTWASPHLLIDPGPSHLGMHDISVSNEVSIIFEHVPLCMVKNFVIPFDPNGQRLLPLRKCHIAHYLTNFFQMCSPKRARFQLTPSKFPIVTPPSLCMIEVAHLQAHLFRFHHYG